MLAEDQKEYTANPSWRHNGIIRNGRAEDYPWTCKFCNRHKQFCALRECGPHCETEAHRNALWWEYDDKGYKAPDVPRWSTMRADGAARDQTRSRRGRSPISGGTSPRPAQSESPPPAADPRDRPSAASAGTWTYTVILNGATLNGVPIDGAVLKVTIPCAGEPPLGGTYVMDAATISGVIRQAHSSTAHGPSPFSPLSQMRAGDSVVDDSSSLRLPMAQTGPASATNRGILPGMTLLFIDPTQPPQLWPPRPIEGAHAGAPWQGAASARADAWRGRCRREDDGEQDSSDSAESPRR